MTNEQYLEGLAALHDRKKALDKEKAQLIQAYLDSLPFKVGDEVYYTPSSTSSSRELRGFIAQVKISEPPFYSRDADGNMCVFVYYIVCPPTKAENAIYGTQEQLKLRKFQDSDR